MLTLPKSLKVTRDHDAEKFLIERLRAWLDKEPRAPGVHASGLLDPRMAYWQIVKPLPLTEREVMMFFIGKGLHESALPGVGTDSGSKMSDAIGVTYSPDEIRGDVPREFKTTRSFYAPKLCPKETGECFRPHHPFEDLGLYLEQECIYMVAEEVTEGGLDVLYINLKDQETKKTEPSVRCFKVTMTKKDALAFRAQCVDARRSIEEAVNTPGIEQPWRKLPLCRKFKCSATGCKWWDDCKPEGRHPNGPKGSPVVIREDLA